MAQEYSRKQNSHNDGEIEEALLALVRELATELEPGRGGFDHLGTDSTLGGDAGLDSLGRMELLRRMERRLGRTVDEDVVVGAHRIGDLLQAIGEASARPRRSMQTAPTDSREEADQGIPEHAHTLVEALEWHARAHPSRTHIHLFRAGSNETEPIQYLDLWESARQIASGLREQGVGPGQSVALMLPTSVEFFQVFTGILLAGAVPVPIYPPARMSQVEDHLRRQTTILDNARAVILVTVPEARMLARLLKSRLDELSDVVTAEQIRGRASGERVRTSARDLALLQYTSGSTGNPKGVALTHANLLANIRAMGRALQVNRTDVFASWLPLYHDMGLIGAWLGTLYYGVPLVLMSPLSFIARPQRWLWAIHQFRATLSASPNFGYDLCTSKIPDADIQGLDLSSLRFTCNGAEPVSAKTIEAFSRRFAPYGFRTEAMAPVYGLAECSVGLTFPPLERGPRVEHIELKPFRTKGIAVPADEADTQTVPVVACGVPLPEHELRIVDDSGIELGDGEVGRLQFRGPSATRGYFRNEEANRDLFQGEWLNSGDYAYLRRGELFVTGRAKDMIIRAGRNIYPHELEQAVGEIDGIRNGGVAVFGSTDPQRGIERLVVLAETRVRDADQRARLRRRIENLSEQLVEVPPDEVVLAPPRSVFKTSSGKVRRSACREQYERNRIGQRHAVWTQIVQLALGTVAPLTRRLWKGVRWRTYFAYAWTVFLAHAVPVWVLVMILPGQRWPAATVRAAVRSALALTGNRYRVLGREHLPATSPCVVVANHASYLDALVLGAALRGRFGFVAKRELSRNWFIRQFLHKLGTFYVERFDPRAGVADMQRLIAAAQGGQPLVFFPEGTFTRVPGVQPFRMGAFMTAVQGQLPVVPTAIRGTRAVLRSATWIPRRGTIEVEFRPPLQPTGNDWEAAVDLRERARAEILRYSDEPDLLG